MARCPNIEAISAIWDAPNFCFIPVFCGSAQEMSDAARQSCRVRFDAWAFGQNTQQQVGSARDLSRRIREPLRPRVLQPETIRISFHFNDFCPESGVPLGETARHHVDTSKMGALRSKGHIRMVRSCASESPIMADPSGGSQLNACLEICYRCLVRPDDRCAVPEFLANLLRPAQLHSTPRYFLSEFSE